MGPLVAHQHHTVLPEALTRKLGELLLESFAPVLDLLGGTHLLELGSFGHLGLLPLPPLCTLPVDGLVHVGIKVPEVLAPVGLLRLRSVPLPSTPALLLSRLFCHLLRPRPPAIAARRLSLCHGAFSAVTSRTRGWDLPPGRPLPVESSIIRLVAPSKNGWYGRPSLSPTVTVGR